MPKRDCGAWRVSVYGVHAVVHRDDEDRVVRAFARYLKRRHIERLSVDFSVDWKVAKLSKAGHVYVAFVENGLIQIGVSSGIVVVSSKDVHLRERRGVAQARDSQDSDA